MKTLHLSIILSSSLLLSVLFGSSVFASCIQDNDWPEKPCYDEFPGPSNEEKTQEWQRYYEFKGKEWMEAKKAEMDEAIKGGTLKEWTEYRSEPENYANYNVWFYYYLNGQAPNPDVDYYDFRNVPDEMIFTSGPSSIYLILIVVLGIGVTLAYMLMRKRKSL